MPLSHSPTVCKNVFELQNLISIFCLFDYAGENKGKKKKKKTNEKVWIINKLYPCFSFSSSEQLRVRSSANKVP